jgi:hypothetical protein
MLAPRAKTSQSPTSAPGSLQSRCPAESLSHNNTCRTPRHKCLYSAAGVPDTSLLAPVRPVAALGLAGLQLQSRLLGQLPALAVVPCVRRSPAAGLLVGWGPGSRLGCRVGLVGLPRQRLLPPGLLLGSRIGARASACGEEQQEALNCAPGTRSPSWRVVRAKHIARSANGSGPSLGSLGLPA